MKTIAAIFQGDIFRRRGLVNAAISRINYLIQTSEYEIVPYVLCYYYPWYLRLLFKYPRIERKKKETIDGVDYNILWGKFSVINYIFYNKLHTIPLLDVVFYRKKASLFKKYDLLTVHSTGPGLIAYHTFKRYHIPYCITWHGSDIHSNPNENSYIKGVTNLLLKNASMNFFVSKNLEQIAHKLSPEFKSSILYNGVDTSFRCFDDEHIKNLKAEFGIQDCKVVAFVGNLYKVKNIKSLPGIFSNIQQDYNGRVCFWVIGDGDERQWLTEEIKNKHVANVVLWGNQDSKKMVNFMNCIDVLVLPSLNEGLPLVTLEALKCGCNVVGSNVGGIPEVIGKDNCFALDEQFEENISARIFYMLSNKVSQSVDSCFDWNLTAKKENAVYKIILE